MTVKNLSVHHALDLYLDGIGQSLHLSPFFSPQFTCEEGRKERSAKVQNSASIKVNVMNCGN